MSNFMKEQIELSRAKWLAEPGCVVDMAMNEK